MCEVVAISSRGLEPMPEISRLAVLSFAVCWLSWAFAGKEGSCLVYTARKQLLPGSNFYGEVKENGNDCDC